MGSSAPRGRARRSATGASGEARRDRHPSREDPTPSLLAQLDAIERAGGDGVLRLPDDRTLPLTHLDRVVFPDDGVTKGALLRYYTRLAPLVLPVIQDRGLVLTRRPAGIRGPGFHQHDPGDHPPDAVRAAELPTADGTPARRLIGSLGSLLWAIQVGAVGVDAWHSRVGDPDAPDYLVLDLDPTPEARFPDVVGVARAVRQALRRRGRDAVLKTSGSRGLHLLVPLAPGATFAMSAALAEEVAQEVADRMPALATVARAIHDRPPGSVYVDHLQNARGKTLAIAFGVRARPGATVSTPLAWTQARATLDPSRYTLRTLPRRAGEVERRWLAAWAHAAPPGAWLPT